MLQSFKQYVCACCKGECHRGITFTHEGAKCVDYEPDVNKIKGYEKKDTSITATKQKALMKLNI